MTGLRLGRLLLTSVRQGAGAPWLDPATSWVTARDGTRAGPFRGVAILPPWQHRRRTPGRALVVALLRRSA